MAEMCGRSHILLCMPWEELSSRLSQTQIKFRGHSYKKRRGKYFIQSQAFYSVCMQSYRSLSNASLLIDFWEHRALASHALLACTLFSSHCHHSDLLQEHEGRADFDVTHLITRCNYFRWRCSYLRQPPRSTCSPDEVCSLVLFAVLSSSVRWEIYLAAAALLVNFISSIWWMNTVSVSILLKLHCHLE